MGEGDIRMAVRGAEHQSDDATEDPIFDVFVAALRYARQREYTGWDYSDGLSSRLLQALPIDNKWVNITFQETIKRAPINIRPLALVEQRRNPMGAALFAMTNLEAAELTGESRYAAEARHLLDWLVDSRVEGTSGYAVGYPHATQGLSKKTDPWVPGVVGTAFATLALLRGSESDQPEVTTRADSYRDIARTSAQFVLEDLDYESADIGARIKYKVNDSGEHYTLNANALGARTLLEIHDRIDEPALRERATSILDYVVSRQTEAGGWMYRDPAAASHLSMDNHHNGFIIEALQRYDAIVGDDRYATERSRAVSFYRHGLFDSDGAPNFDEKQTYPRDVHAAAQGILVFTRAGDRGFAKRIIDWTIDNLYGPDGQFYYRKHRFHTKRFTLMRWCQAWMTYALSRYLRTENPELGSRTFPGARNGRI